MIAVGMGYKSQGTAAGLGASYQGNTIVYDTHLLDRESQAVLT